VPFARATANADRVFRALMISSGGIRRAILVMNAAYFLWCGQLHFARVADRSAWGTCRPRNSAGRRESASVTRS
jgi:hypothetical protein